MTPSPLFLCISETVRCTAMRFCNIVQDFEGYLSLYKVLSHLYRKCGHDGVKPEVHFRRSAKSRMLDCKSHDYIQATNTFIDYFHIFMGTSPESAVGMFLDVNIHQKYNMADE